MKDLFKTPEALLTKWHWCINPSDNTSDFLSCECEVYSIFYQSINSSKNIFWWITLYSKGEQLYQNFVSTANILQSMIRNSPPPLPPKKCLLISTFFTWCELNRISFRKKRLENSAWLFFFALAKSCFLVFEPVKYWNMLVCCCSAS